MMNTVETILSNISTGRVIYLVSNWTLILTLQFHVFFVFLYRGEDGTFKVADPPLFHSDPDKDPVNKLDGKSDPDPALA